MESRRDKALAALAAFALAGAGFFLGTGLHPWPWLIWLAPLPVLLLAPRVPAWCAALAAFGAWLVGELNEWSYIHEVGLSTGRVVRLYVEAAILFTLAVLLFRGLVLRGRWIAATVALPVFWVSAEYLFATFTPDGAFWSLAYTQADDLPLVQVASVTGYVGITFLILLVPSLVAVLVRRGPTRAQRLRLTAAVAVVLVAVLAFGAIRLTSGPPAGPVQRVALVSQGGDGDRVDVTTPAGQRLLAGYLEQVRAVITAGASIVVLPEAVFRADPAALPALTAAFGSVARETGASIVVGVGLVDPSAGDFNTAQVVAPDGSVVVYRKQHLTVTEPYQPGDQLVFTTGANRALAVEICKDMDFPALARDNRRAGARMLLVPAWDFDRDAWLHSRMAILRGVENGIPVARSARMGALTVSDPYGRVVTEARTGPAPFVAAGTDIAIGGVSTVYTTFGPWFAWLCLIALAGLLGRLLLGRLLRGRLRLGRRRESTVDSPESQAPERVSVGSTA